MAQFEVRCSCGRTLKADFLEFVFRGNLVLEVEPCERCKDESYFKGIEEGDRNAIL